MNTMDTNEPTYIHLNINVFYNIVVNRMEGNGYKLSTIVEK